MKQKLTFLFALLCVSVIGWADTEKFVAANAEIDHTYFRTNGWAEETTPSTCVWSNGELTVSMTESKNEQWQAQVFLDTKITYDASKQYDISFDIITSNGVGGVMVKLGNTGTLYYETITTGASVLQHYAKQNVQGVAANDGMLIFDFGYAPANTDVTISNISIIEKEPVITPYCQRATGHLGQANFGDANGRILLTLTKKSDSSVGVKVEPNNGGIDVFDFVEVILGGVSKTLGTVGGSAPTTSEIEYDGLASLDFNINVLWHHKTWADAGGRWTTQQFAVSEAELCPAPIESEYCAYQGSETQQDGHYFAITFETDPSGNVVVTIGNGTGAGACSFRNGGFEGGNNGLDNFVVSDDNFATTSPATDYFTVTRPTDGDMQYVLTKTADLPANAKIKHLTAGAIAWKEAGVDRWCFPEFIYTYGAICTEEPELTSISLSASASIAQVGSGITLTATPLDQFGAPIEATINYAISPADAGSISGNVFTFTKTGAATITASSGAVEESITLYGVSSANIALNKTCEAGYEDGNAAETAAKANDGSDGDDYHGWVTWEASSADVEWWYVDLGALYDITAISALWGTDYSSNYILQVRNDAPAEGDKANDEAWTTVATVTNASANNVAMNYVTTTGRYVRLHSLSKSGACIRLRELQVFGSEAATLTKSVSASVNDPAMGTATVKQSGVDVTEVATGSEVTFSAVANEGYVFANWSNGETRASFDATVDAAMHLTANFHALGNVYCNTEMTVDGHTIFVTMKRSNTNEYKLVVRSEEELVNFGGTVLYKPENVEVQNLRDYGVLSTGNHTLTATVSSDKAPYFGTPLYVVFGGVGEVTYGALTNIEYDAPCNDNVSVSSISVAPSAVVAIGSTTALTAAITPVYATNQAVNWTSDANGIASVNSAGVVTGVSTGTAHITATTVDGGLTAQCTVTVIESPVYWNNGRDADYDVSIAYSIEYNSDKTLTYTIEAAHDKVGFVVRINDGEWHDASSLGDNKYEFTTTATYEVNDVVNGQIYMPFAGGAAGVNYSYTVGATTAEVLVPIYLNDEADNASKIAANANKTRDVLFTRTFPQTGEWYTLCLPFDMSEAQMTATFGAGYTLATMTGAEDRGSLIHLNFDYVRAMEAGKPYLLRPGTAVTVAPTISAVTIQDIEPIQVGDAIMKFEGTFNQITLNSANQRFVGPENYLYSPADGGTEMDAFRCFFTIPSGSPAPGRMAKIFFAPEIATGVEHTQSNDVQNAKVLKNGQLFIIRDGRTYNAMGVLVK